MAKGDTTRDKLEQAKKARPGTRLWFHRKNTEAIADTRPAAKAKEAAARAILEKRREKDNVSRKSPD